MKRIIALLASWVLACPLAFAQMDILVQRGDNSRTGQNLTESVLTQSTVNSAGFGKLYAYAVDGYTYGQPLYKTNLTIPGKGTFNVAFVVTEHGSVYAFDVDSATPLWQAVFINPAAGVTTQPSADTGTTDIIPEVSITSTPVIDPTSNTLYVVAKTKENGHAVYRIHALDITTGANRVSPVVISASVPKTGGGTESLIADDQQQRVGLVLVNGVVYVGFGSSGDAFPWAGFLLGYNATTLAQTTLFCASKSGSGAGFWSAGEAPAVDTSGNLYIMTGNGNYDGVGDWGDSFLKLSTSGGLSLVDWFTPFNQAAMNNSDLDIASAGQILLPDSAGTAAHPHLMVGGGKNGTIYLLDRDNMGHYNGSYTNPDSRIPQWIANAVGTLSNPPTQQPLPYVENNYTTPAYWQNRIYYCGINDHCKLFTLNNGLLSTSPASQSAATFPFGGGQPVITAASSSATSAIMWAIERDTTNNKTTLHAFDATNLATELYNSNQASGGRDYGGPPVKFVVPTVSNGKVIIGTETEIDVYGLLAGSPSRLAAPTFSPAARSYTNAQSVTLSANPGAVIYYTLDGTNPTLSSTQYTGPINVSSTTTITAIAVQNGFYTSPTTVGTYTIGATGTTSFVQSNYADPQTSQSNVTVVYPSAQLSGDLNVVVVGWSDATATVKSVTDTSGNTYTLAIGPSVQSGTATQSIYYAKNIAGAAANTNTVTVAFNGTAAFPDIRILEYSGIDTNSPVDVSSAAMGSSGSSTTSATTTFANDLVIGANLTQTVTTAPGSGFTSRILTSPDTDIVEDRTTTATGTVTAAATINPSGAWIMQLVAFKVATASGPTPTAPTSLAAAAVSSSEIDLSWTAATETGGTISQYLIERCQGSGCSNFAQVGTATGTTFNDTGLTASTSYTYRVRAQDASNNTGPYSNTSTAATVGTVAPTAPGNLAAAAQGDSEIDLTWDPSTEAGGTISQYLIESCTGLNCSNFAQIGTSTTTAFNNTGLTPSTSYSYRVRAVDTANNFGPYSTIVTMRTRSQVLPSAPTNLTATASGSSQINLSWGASTETGGTISQYLIARCAGAGCSTFAQVGTSTTLTFSDTGLSASTSYSYQVSAVDNTSHTGPASNIATAVTSAGTGGGTPIAFVQSNFTTPQSAQTTVTLKYTAAQASGDLNVVVVGWSDATTQVSSVTDSSGNPYTLAVGPTVQSGTATQSIYYAPNIIGATANSNTVTVKFSAAAAFPDIRILEYSGIAQSSPVDVTAAGQGNSASSSSGAATTTFANDLLVGANLVQTLTSGAGTGFTSRQITPQDGDIVEDRIVTATGSYTATAPLASSGQWIMQLVAFKGSSSSTGTPTAPSSLTATAVSTTQINLAWTAASETGGTISQYLIERCQGSGCSNFAQIGTATGTSFNDTGLSSSTSYSYRVRASDSSNVTGPYSNTATATTQTPAVPTAPTGLTASGVSTSQINLSWTASTETGGTISQYLVERCQGVGCTSFSQVGTSTSTAFNDTGLTSATSYSYRVRASDTNNVTGPYSSTATASTQGSNAPTAPGSLTATATSSTQINLTWTASTETGGTISQYLIERCSGSGCSNFAQIATSTTTSYINTGLTGSTSYSYRVRASDTNNVTGPYSSVATTSTSAPTFTAPSNLTASASGTQIALTWTAATETGGTISQYLIERCSGSGCSNFAQIATSTTTSYTNTGLTASTSYSYRVRATDAASNTSPYSNTATATTGSTPPPIAFVQRNFAVPQSSQATVTVKYTAAQSAGNLNVVVVGWSDATAGISSVVDSSGNAYALAVGPTVQAGTATQAIYYAYNIKAAAANANTVTVTFSSAAAFPDIRILEYSGLDTTNPLDAVSASQGSSTSSSTGPVTTTFANELIIGANLVQTTTSGAGTGFTSRVITSPDGDIVEDRTVTATGAYSATAPVANGQWIMQLATFRRHP